MKIKLLFISGCLDSGGVSKSIISLLNVIDKDIYDVSLLITNPTGLFMNLLPQIKGIHVLTDEKMACLFQRFAGVRKLLRRGNYFLALMSLFRMGLSKINRGYSGWILSRLMPALKSEFDVIIDYGGQQQLYYMVDKLHAKLKISFFHNDYAKWPYYYNIDRYYYKKVDKVYTISETCLDSLRRFFPCLKDKSGVMENISSCEIIEKLACEEVVDISFLKNKYTFLTIGHVCPDKGTDFLVEAVKILRDKQKFDFIWYIIGDVRPDSTSFYQNILSKIEEYGLKDYICFLGTRLNPYPYIKRADLYIHPSRFEGKSIALDEAKILCKPIVVTDFSTVSDQFCNGYNASICAMDSRSLASAITELILSKERQELYIQNLLKDKKDNSDEIEVLYKVINEVCY